MIYLYYGSEYYLIVKAIEERLKAAQIDDFNTLNFDGAANDFDLFALINACETLPFLGARKAVLFKNPPFLFTKANDKLPKNALDSFLKYCHDAAYAVDLFIYNDGQSFNKSLKIFKELSKCAQTKAFEALNADNFTSHARKLCEEAGLKLDDAAFKLLVLNSKRDLSLLNSNIQKLALYGETCDYSAVAHLSDPYLEDKIYELTSALFKRNPAKTIAVYRDLTANDFNIFLINASLAASFRTMAEINYYLKQHYSDAAISEMTKIPKNRLYYLKKDLQSFGRIDYLKLLAELAKLDQKLKSGANIAENLRYEILLLNLLKDTQ